eukprot:scaffold25969_cov52-Attheya_sp.AAC.1
MEAITVQDDNQNDINLLTFHGEDEWATDTLQDEIDIILKSQASIRKPFLLAPPSIADVSADASIEVTSGVQGLEKLALEAAWDYITQAVFDKICPNFTQDPAAVIQEITQEQVDPKTGERIALTIEQYHNAILNSANFFPQSGEWEVDVVQHFMTHLSSSIKIQVKAIPFTYISDSSRKAPFQHMIWLQKAFSAASTAEATLDQVRTIAQQEYATHHTLHSNIEVNASVAERMISKYIPSKCWNCEDPDHVYMKASKIICPKANEPGATERAQKGRETFNSMIKKKRSSSNKSNSGGGKRSFAAMFAKHTKDVSEDEISSFFTSRSPQKSKKSGNDSDAQRFSILVYAASSGGAKELLPITFDPMLPHFMIGVGPVGQTPSISLLAAYDTAAVANIGWSDFHLAFAKKFPSAVKSITWAKDKYTPLTLSGVVTDDDKSKQEALCTSLPVVIEYHMPYQSKASNATSIKFALGKHVGVNSIVDNSTIRSAKMSMDVVDEVIDSGVSDTEPFEITYHHTNKRLPNFTTIDESGSNAFLTTSDQVVLANLAICDEIFQDAHVEANHTDAPAGTKVTSSAIVSFNNSKPS